VRSRRSWRYGLCVTAGLVCGVWLYLQVLTPVGAASLSPERVKQLRKLAAKYEREHNWEKACELYEQVLRFNSTLSEFRARYRHALRRYYQVRRHLDTTYRKDVLTLEYNQSLNLYKIVLHNLLDGTVDKHKLTPGLLFRKGLEELSNALADPTFCQTRLRGLRPEQTRAFRDHLRRTWGSAAAVLTREDALERVREVAMKALSALRLDPTTTVLEFTCGSCYAIDDYTVYLPPGQFRELADLLKRGAYVGVGARLAVVNNKLIIDEVYDNSPAEDKKLVRGDVVLTIDKKPAAGLSAEAAMRLLEGEAGTTVTLEILRPGRATPEQPVVLKRRAFVIPSVAYRMESGVIGYVRITCFQDTTLGDLDTALAKLSEQGMKSLILDLRGNSGGLFKAGVETVRRFLAQGVIVRERYYDPSLDTVHEAQNPAALTLPLVVLVDGETASAAEVVAGALKDHKRACLVGQTTYGKGCTQGLLPLPVRGLLKYPQEETGQPTGAIRITVSHFFSPAGYPYTGRGVTPDIPADLDPEQQFSRALEEAQRQLGMMMQ
jgi:carboxyl-terminal processing protease